MQPRSVVPSNSDLRRHSKRWIVDTAELQHPCEKEPYLYRVSYYGVIPDERKPCSDGQKKTSARVAST